MSNSSNQQNNGNGPEFSGNAPGDTQRGSDSDDGSHEKNPRRISLGFSWHAPPLNTSWNTLLKSEYVPRPPENDIKYHPLAMELSRQTKSGAAEFFSRPTSDRFIFSISQLGGCVDKYEPCKLLIAVRSAREKLQGNTYDAKAAWYDAFDYIRKGQGVPPEGTYIEFVHRSVDGHDDGPWIEFKNKDPGNVPAYDTPKNQNWTVTKDGQPVVLQMKEGVWEVSFWLLVRKKDDHCCTKVFVGDPVTCTSGGKCY